MIRTTPLLAIVMVMITVTAVLDAQVVRESYIPASGLLRIGPGPDEVVERTDTGHTLVLPDRIEPLGAVVLPDGFRVSPAAYLDDSLSFEREALRRGLAVVRLTTGNPLDFYFDDSTVASVGGRLQAVLDEAGMGAAPVVLCGMSLAGTRVLKLAIHMRRHPERYSLRLAGAAIVDAPLDMVRFHAAEQQAIRDDFHPAAAGEGRWVSWMLETHLGGTPQERWQRYVDYSPYVHGAPDGGNAALLADLPLRAYHEPDVNWWIENRRKDYYGMNSLDLAALINELRRQGNGRADLITTCRARKGYAEGASPHTGSIVDNADLADWAAETTTSQRR